MSHKHQEEKQKRKQIELYAMVAAAVVLAFLFAFLLPLFKDKTLDTGPVDSVSSDVQTFGRHPLTGFPVTEETTLPHVFGVMIDNHVEAWPQAGIDQAFLVYEVPVEGGISRLLAFFYDGQDVAKIGPVRSARPYFLDWNNELDALYTHVGGSNAALDLISSGGTFDLNEYWNGNSFWRARNRYAPHNTYTSTDLLSAYVDLKTEQGRVSAPLYESWLFKDSQLSELGDVSEIKVSFLAPTYVAKWKLDTTTDRYARLQAGAADLTEDGNQVMADNVIVVVTDMEVIDSVGRRKVRTIGEGDAFVFQDGQVMKAVWKKDSENQRIRFYDEEGSEVKLNAGVTWVEMIPSLDDLSY